ncbi:MULTISPECIES: bifunctional helix-turn-helix transcriptional regulator/GNAT family N-acetyltransferase [unclassified Amycolatopsis]|uniref:bifunctional helix-turn-helix transcriptional regulator/GNAT family N-acetyltransferase n=1 Tax=unclassified Amycolatopsis TaxID=2618356 RepID=UPI0028770C80|nr:MULTISPECIES: bifunctional helix-turn-helix transcriptional regulator/GNAT family N-acetyltransferase [unclassified Amycolatopsis]MDS0134150.1 MarR family transcriptional regulator [Amycolatopsis sp. 505]MDS0145026.1 MarR family transcriptional regulator [Amycolatopsis sp. CM201R]
MNEAQLADRVAAVRAFNRLYTSVIGVLDEGPADAEYSLPEARVLFELAHQDPLPVTDLRKRLDLDAGYASRLLARLESRGLVVRERSEEDARRQLVRPTAAGRDAFAVLNRRSTDQIGGLLRRFADEDQQRLLTAMRTIGDLVGDRRRDPALVLRPPRPGDLGWVVERHGALYAREYGFGAPFEALVARLAAHFLDNTDNPRQAFWIAELDGERVGSIGCGRGPDADTAKIRLLLIEPSARGHGVGKRLVTECVAFARAHRYRAMELSTVSILDAARSIYRAVGFQLVAETEFDDWGPKLTDETWRLEF